MRERDTLAAEILAGLPSPHPVDQNAGERQERHRVVGDRHLHVRVGGRRTSQGPDLDGPVFYGLAGDFVRTVDPHTEADPVALLVQFLVAFGSAVGAGPHVVADGAWHYPRLFVVLVGETARARKGTSWRHVRNLFRIADEGWSQSRVLGGLSSGEGLIAEVSDGERGPEGNIVGAVEDKRLLVVEEEFSRVLVVKGRETNTLSAIIRQAWDNGDLRTMTKRPMSATGAHISIVAHITVEELTRTLTATDQANGFANRFLFVTVARSKLLPNGGNLDEEEVRRLGGRVHTALAEARRIGRVSRSPETEERWAALYRDLARSDTADLAGMIVARAEAQVLRLSLLYALTDGSRVIDVPHLAAAEALWRYSEASVRHIFVQQTGDPEADRLLVAIRRAGPEGIDGTAQRDALGRHGDPTRARGMLERRGLIVSREEPTGGRPRLVSVAVECCDESDRGDQSPLGETLSSHSSLSSQEHQARYPLVASSNGVDPDDDDIDRWSAEVEPMDNGWEPL